MRLDQPAARRQSAAMRAIVLALGLVSTQAAAAEQFDLICTSQKSQVRYRIDLIAGEWCAGECSAIFKIAEVTAGTIVLEHEKGAFARDKEAKTEINRLTGEWSVFAFNPALEVVPFVQKGFCVPGAFSGFPTPKF
jgi:hypothetical protein